MRGIRSDRKVNLGARLEEFGKVVPWLMLNREGLSVLVHPSTGDGYGDHLVRSLW